MEESYQTAVRRERTQSIQALNFELKYMIVGHITAFQGRNFWGTAVLRVVYKSILCSQKEKLFVLFLISLACLWFTSLFFDDPAFGKRWWHLVLTGILSICQTLGIGLSLAFVHRIILKKKIGTDFFQGIFKCHLGAWWLVVLFDVLLCCQTIYRYRMLNENAFICLMLKNMCSNWYVKWEHSSLCVKMCHYLAGHMKSDLFSRIMATQLNMNAWRNLVCSCNSCCSQSYLALTGWCKSMQFLHTDGYCTTTGRKMLV